MAPWWILIFVIGLSKRATCDYDCTMESLEVTCSGIDTSQLSQKVSVTLNKNDAVSLNLTNGIVPSISETIFQDFINLQSLYVTDCAVSNLENNAFSHSLDLKHLYLNNNPLTKFNVRSLSPENGLNVLDLSRNLLNELSDFNVSYFPKLTVLNLANNFLTYLPLNLISKLEEQNQFYLVADNNPWNCSDSNWSEYLTENLINAFCSNKIFDYTPQIKKGNETEEPQTSTTQKETTPDFTTENNAHIDINSLQPFIKQGGSEIGDVKIQYTTVQTDQKKDQECEKPNCGKCSFYFCLLWFFCGIWIGIILGNIVKIKNLLCTTSAGSSDKFTQCEQSMSDQYMVSGFHLDFRRDRRASTADSNTKSKENPTT